MIGLFKPSSFLSYNLIAYKNGEIIHQFNINLTKTLVGSFEKSDIYIENDFVSHYHAFINYDKKTHELFIVDLSSKNGTFLNGEKILNAKLLTGDRIQFGDIEFLVETFDEKISILDQDKGRVNIMEEKLIIEKSPELPPLPGLSLIDGEYCNIIFDEVGTFNIDSKNFLHKSFSSKDYIDIVEEKEDEVFEIERESDLNAIEVSILSNGNILSSRYFPLHKKTNLSLSDSTENKKTILFEALDFNQKTPFITIGQETIKLHKFEEFSYHNISNNDLQPFHGGTTLTISDDDYIVINYKTLQIMVKKTKAPSKLIGIPLFARDKEALLHLSKTIGILMSLVLLLLLVDTNIELTKTPKKISIIYKYKSKKIDNINTQAVANNNHEKDPGEKKNTTKNEKKVASSAAPKMKEKKKKIEVAKKIASSNKNSKREKNNKPKIKAYEFKMKKSFSGLFNKNKSIKNLKVSKNSNKSFSQSSSLVANTSMSQKSSSNFRNTASLGPDYSGKEDESFGTKGFSRNGFDTTSMSTKTVVLGSIDPELLRKILREYIPQFRHCYQNELRDNSDDIKGIIDLNFRINPNGNISKVHIKGKKTRFSHKGIGCMASVLKLIDFPTPKGGGLVDVKQPLNFLSERERIN